MYRLYHFFAGSQVPEPGNYFYWFSDKTSQYLDNDGNDVQDLKIPNSSGWQSSCRGDLGHLLFKTHANSRSIDVSVKLKNSNESDGPRFC